MIRLLQFHARWIYELQTPMQDIWLSIRTGMMIPKLIPLSVAGALDLPVGDATSITHTITELTLTGALIIAVKVLWESNKTKDNQVLLMATKVTETMALVMRAVEELRTATTDLGVGLDNLSSQIAALEVAISPRGKL